MCMHMEKRPTVFNSKAYEKFILLNRAENQPNKMEQGQNMMSLNNFMPAFCLPKLTVCRFCAAC